MEWPYEAEGRGPEQAAADEAAYQKWLYQSSTADEFYNDILTCAEVVWPTPKALP